MERQRKRLANGLIIAGLSAAMLLAGPVLADDVEAPRCVEVRKSAPYRGYGHHHIVTVSNTCEEAVRCRVSTNVTPAPHSLEVEAGAEESVVTRTGSPASVFEAIVECETR